MSKPNVEIKYTYISKNLSKYDFYRSLLSSEEKERADRFYFQKDRDCYTVARGLLKLFLAEYLQIKPENIKFTYNQYGKPFVEGIHFNISHSKDIIVFAFSKDLQLGIDIEYMKDNVKYKQLINRFFSSLEIKDFLSLDESFHQEAFFNGWSRKEAYIKAVGKGLNIPLDSFDVSLQPNQPAKLIAINNQLNNKWSILDINIDKQYKSALAIETNYFVFIINQYTL